MKNPEIQNIKTLFDQMYNGPAWHGPSIQQALKDISHKEALKNVGEANNIAELVYHMIAWRNFLINKLKGQHHYDVSDEENFRKYESISEQEWIDLNERLEDSHREIQELLSAVDDDILDQQIGMRDYTFYTLMHGVIQHDLYHLGQIVMLKKHT